MKCKTQSCFCCSSKVIPITSFSPLIKPYLRVSRRHIDLQTASIRHSTLCLSQTFHKHISGGIKLTLFWSLKTDWVKLKLLFCSNIIFCKLIVRIIHPFFVRTLWFTAVKTAGGCRTLTEQLKASLTFIHIHAMLLFWRRSSGVYNYSMSSTRGNKQSTEWKRQQLALNWRLSASFNARPECVWQPI